jgi:Leucine-rich repeat (LRR) protein
MKNNRGLVSVGVAGLLVGSLVVFTVGSQSSPAVAAGDTEVVPVSPVRVLESRSGRDFTTIDGLFQATGRSGANKVVEFQVAGRGGVNADAAAVFLNVVAVNPASDGYLTVFPCGITPPNAANVNYDTGDVVGSAVFSKIGAGGKVCVYSLADTDLIIDVNGYVPAGSGVTPVPPARVLESRSGRDFTTIDGLFQATGRSGANKVVEFQVAGRGGVNADAAAVFLNVVAVNPASDGYLTVFPCGITPPNAANVNYDTGDIVGNAVFSKIGADGKVCVYTLADTDLTIDVNGYVLAPSECDGVDEIPAAECEALVALYNSANGDGWTDNTNWLDTTTPCSWHGVECSDGHVTYMNLSNNSLSGPIPAELGTLTKLEYLILTNNLLSGPIPVKLGDLTDLEFLYLGVNLLSGEIPVELGSLPNLQRLFLNGNSLSGEIPAELGGLTNLKTLYLNNNLLEGSIPGELGDLTDLQHLYLSENSLSGEIPVELGDLTNLEYLDLYYNSLSGEIPVELGDLTNLQNLGLGDNLLEGSIPVELGDLTNLQKLDLNSNLLEGSIPAELGDLTNLQKLDLNSNLLEGSIPVKLGDLTNLQYIDLSYNSLSGEIPVELGDLTKLTYMNLSNNSLSGSIPVKLGDLTNLQRLYLNNNSLSGPIPAEIQNLTSLTAMGLRGNECLTADMSTSTPTSSFLDRFDLSWDDGCD